MALVKAFIPGLFLTFVVAIVLGSNGAAGGWLDVHKIHLEQLEFFWSWPLFLISTALGWFVFSTID